MVVAATEATARTEADTAVVGDIVVVEAMEPIATEKREEEDIAVVGDIAVAEAMAVIAMARRVEATVVAEVIADVEATEPTAKREAATVAVVATAEGAAATAGSQATMARLVATAGTAEEVAALATAVAAAEAPLRASSTLRKSTTRMTSPIGQSIVAYLIRYFKNWELSPPRV